jgi:putative transposase
MVSVPARRSQVAYATGKGLSQRRACTLIGVGRSALHYRSVKAEKDAPVLKRMAELSALYPRYGYRRIAVFLGRDGHRLSFGRAHRLWRRAKLQVPRKRPRKRVATSRPRPDAPTGANQVWSYDFVFDWCANGQQLKCLTVSDEWTKEGLAPGWTAAFARAGRSRSCRGWSRSGVHRCVLGPITALSLSPALF